MATPTAAQVTRIRRMVAEADSSTYDDTMLSAIIQLFPLYDSDGYDPDDSNWTGTWDMNRAAAEVWAEKAAALGGQFDFTDANASYKRSQKQSHAEKQRKYFSARAAPGTIRFRRATYANKYGDPTISGDEQLENVMVNL